MSLSKRLSLLFPLLAIIPLIFLGIIGYANQKDSITRSTITNLIAVSEIQKKRVNEVLTHYLDVVHLITSRTQLRALTDQYQNNNSPTTQRQIETIIQDAKNSSDDIRDIIILSKQGKVIASTNTDLDKTDYSTEAMFALGLQRTALYDIIKDDTNTLQVVFVGPLYLDGEVVGVITIVTTAIPMINITSDYSGLGETGEIVLAKKNASGDAVFLTPLRFEAGAALNTAVSKSQKNSPIVAAVYGEEDIYVGDKYIDYRGKNVFAVTRYVDALEWGIVTKIDRSEVLAPIRKLTKAYILISLISSIFILLVSLLVSQNLTSPIKKLTEFAKSLDSGRLNLRTDIVSADEIGFLGKTLNDMADRLQSLYTGLEKKVEERTQDLQKFKLAVDNTSDMVVITDVNGKVIFMNKAAEQITGYMSSDAVGKKAGELWGKMMGADYYEKLWKRIKIDKKPFIGTIKNRRKNGVEFDSAISIAPILNANKDVLYFVDISRDITKERDIDRMKTEFISLASHQLRTPLSAMKWFLEMLLDGDAGKLTKEQSEYITNINASNERMIALVNSLLNISRIESGRIIVEPIDTDLKKLINGVLKDLENKFKEKKQSVTVSIHPELSHVLIDPKLISNVYMNFLSNAYKYSPEGAEITLIVSKKDDKIISQIADNGYGIPKDEHDKLFGRFFRASNIVKTDTDGTGLGLYLVKAIIESSGGEVWFDSTEGKGSTFWFSLPLSGMKAKKGEVRLDS